MSEQILQRKPLNTYNFDDPEPIEQKLAKESPDATWKDWVLFFIFLAVVFYVGWKFI
jgi:membrane-anchored glycerophosphoryl diester phosphodiesterase (GDPDase)